jgi:hypothetical protein
MRDLLLAERSFAKTERVRRSLQRPFLSQIMIPDHKMDGNILGYRH